MHKNYIWNILLLIFFTKKINGQDNKEKIFFTPIPFEVVLEKEKKEKIYAFKKKYILTPPFLKKIKDKDIYIIVTLDGGGIKGIIPATILAHIEEKTGISCTKLFDCFSGTSTGGILSCLLNIPDKNNQPKYTAESVLNIYKNLGKKIFQKRWTSFNGFYKPLYDEKKIESFLQKKLGNITLNQSLSNIIIPTYCIKNNDTLLFSKILYKNKMLKNNDNIMMHQVARMTSAAPTFFSPVSYNNFLLVDGCVTTNNPSLIAYLLHDLIVDNQKTLFICLSIGTGQEYELEYELDLIKNLQNGGKLKWIKTIINFISDSYASHEIMIDYNSIKTNLYYIRIQPSIPAKHTEIDNVKEKNMDLLEEYTKKYINNEGKELIDNIINFLQWNYYNKQLKQQKNFYKK